MLPLEFLVRKIILTRAQRRLDLLAREPLLFAERLAEVEQVQAIQRGEGTALGKDGDALHDLAFDDAAVCIDAEQHDGTS